VNLDGIKVVLGTLTFDKDTYVGKWKDGSPNGLGTYTLPDGQKYVGEYKNGKRNGQGTLTYSNGSKYVGEWKDSNRNGQGVLTYSNGSKYVGEWKDGERWYGIQYDKNGNITVKYVKGEWIKQ
jgi:hypothetical protein